MLASTPLSTHEHHATYTIGMQKIVFLTGNPNKAKNMSRLLGIDIDHQKVDVDEIQSKSPEAVIERKVRQAYELIQKPVMVDDFSMWLDDLDGLPGPFIKFFVDAKNGLINLCRIADGLPSRRATARSYIGIYDGEELKIFYGEIKGEISNEPRGGGEHAYGSDPVFIADGYNGKTRSELTAEQYDEVYMRVRPLQQVREYLQLKNYGS